MPGLNRGNKPEHNLTWILVGYHYIAGQYGNEQIFPEAPTHHKHTEEMKKHLAELKVLLEKRPAPVPARYLKMSRWACI